MYEPIIRARISERPTDDEEPELDPMVFINQPRPWTKDMVVINSTLGTTEGQWRPLHWMHPHPNKVAGCTTICQLMTIKLLEHLAGDKYSLDRPPFDEAREAVYQATGARAMETFLNDLEKRVRPSGAAGMSVMGMKTSVKRRMAWRGVGACLTAGLDSIRAFYEGNESLRETLLNIGKRPVVYWSPHPYWGMGPYHSLKSPACGVDGATNWWGILIMLSAQTVYMNWQAAHETNEDDNPEEDHYDPESPLNDGPEEAEGTNDAGQGTNDTTGQTTDLTENAGSMEIDSSDETAAPVAPGPAAAETGGGFASGLAGIGRGKALEQRTTAV
jgi:hypothetical protein